MTQRYRAVLVASSLAMGLAGCGLKGPLYLPEKSKEVVVRPGPAAASTPATGAGTAAEAPPPPETPTPETPPPETPTPSPPGTDRG